MRLCDHRRGTRWLLLGVLAGAAGCGGSKTPPPETAESATDESAAPEDETGGDETGSDEATEGAADDTSEPEESSGAAAEPKAGGDTHRHEEETRTTALIADVVKKNRDKARVCYDKAAKDTPRLSGDVVIHFVLDPEGKVQQAELNQERSTIAIPALTTCVIDVIKSLSFPPSSRGMETKVNYPFNFRP